MDAVCRVDPCKEDNALQYNVTSCGLLAYLSGGDCAEDLSSMSTHHLAVGRDDITGQGQAAIVRHNVCR